MNSSSWVDDLSYRHEEIQALKDQIEELKKYIQKLEDKREEPFSELISEQQKLYLINTKIVNQKNESFINDLKGENYNMYTITFSPVRFNRHSDSQYISYIYHHLLMIFFQYNSYIYGCIEHHENGVVHTHLILQSKNSHKEIKRYLDDNFNHDIRNRHCIDMRKITDMEGALKYINKECPYGMPKYWYELKNEHHKKSQVEVQPLNKQNEESNILQTIKTLKKNQQKVQLNKYQRAQQEKISIKISNYLI